MENENKVMPEEQIDIVSETAETEKAEPEKRCPKCQALISEEQLFCPECGTSLKKVCKRCNSELQENQAFCPSCGLNVAENFSVAPTNINEYNAVVMNNQKKPKTMKIVLSAIIAACICVTLIFVVNERGKTSLHNKLMADEWSGLSSDGDTLLYLDFSDDEIDYSGYFGILGKRNVSTFDYKVISKDKISVRGQKINVKFSDDGYTVTFAPSFIDSRSVTVWTK